MADHTPASTEAQRSTEEPPPIEPPEPARVAGPEPEFAGSLFRDQSFRLLFAAAAVSMLGTQISLLALPLVAVIALNASPVEVGLLGTLSTAAFLLIGLPAGAWMDRIRRRRVMVAADLVRAAILPSVPIAWWLGGLTMAQLYVVVFVQGIATVFFDVSSQSYLPSIVARNRLVEANSRLAGWDAANSVLGPSVAGFLIQLITAPAAAIVDAVSYLWSAVCLARIRHRESIPEGAGQERHLLHEIGEGVVLVFRHPLLRPIAINGAATNLSVQIAVIMLPVMFKRELGLSAGALGLFFAVDGVGMLLGALTARRVTRWLGEGRAIWILGIAVIPACMVFPLINDGPWLWAAGVAWFLMNYRIGVNNVVLISFRQRVTPHRLLGRMNATMRFLMTGILSIGAALSGVVGQFVGVRAALWVAAIGLALVWLPIYFSPFRTMTALPDDQLGS
jgi:predicted MFS family arabinose efflux permease